MSPRRPERGSTTWPAGKTVRATLSRPTPLYVAYWSSFVDDDHGVNFRTDIYGWDKALAARLDGSGDGR